MEYSKGLKVRRRPGTFRGEGTGPPSRIRHPSTYATPIPTHDTHIRASPTNIRLANEYARPTPRCALQQRKGTGPPSSMSHPRTYATPIPTHDTHIRASPTNIRVPNEYARPQHGLKVRRRPGTFREEGTGPPSRIRHPSTYATPIPTHDTHIRAAPTNIRVPSTGLKYDDGPAPSVRKAPGRRRTCSALRP
ncbi:UNVERIFIED_ORG: hypothetical protein J3D58_003960 [Paenarthrobacter nicotinovorans]